MLQVAKRISIITAALVLMAASAMADIGGWTENWNEYMRIQMGQSAHGDCVIHPPSDIHQDRPGRWGIYTIKGDPESSDDDNLPVVPPAADGGPVWYYGYSTIYVDGTSAVFGDTDDGGWDLAPLSSDREIGNYVGLNGFYIRGNFRTKTGNIVAEYKMSIVRDQVRFQVLLRNEDSAPHNVGLRHFADLMTGLTDGILYSFIPGRGIVMSETSLTGNDIPDYVEFYNDAANPTVAYRSSLRFEDCTPPDRVAIGPFGGLGLSFWDWSPVPDRIVGDYGYAVWWNPVALNPGESRTIITYIGMAAASSSWTSSTGASGSAVREDPFCVAVQGPRALSIDYSSATSPSGMLQTNPFTVKAYVYNLYRDTTLRNINVHLTLPPGLELVSGDPMQPITSISPESEAVPVSWQVRATGKVTGELKYWVSVSGDPELQKTVTRTIMIPATSSTPIRQGWQMVSVPFKFSDPRIEQSLALTADSYRAFYWDTQTKDYRPVETISPGRSFWINSSVDKSNATIASDGKPLSGADESYSITLYTGWNQFGNPYLYCIPWGRVKVLSSAQDSPMSIEEAASRNIVRSTIYWYDVDVGEYQWSSSSLTNLMPWTGYWIKALQPCRLQIPKVEQAQGGISGDTTRSRFLGDEEASAAKSDGWRLRLVAKAGDATDSKSLIGVDTRASDAYDSADVERPPSPGDYVAISFPHKDWGVNSGNYLTDIRRSTGGDQAWEFEVTTDKANTDVVLTWPTIMDVPKDCSLKIVDVDGSKTRFIRTASSYRYNSGSGGTRRFKLVSETGTSGRLLVTGLAVNASRAVGGAAISYNLSVDAAADVRIKSASGRVVRTVARSRGVTRGISSLAWNYRDEAGKPVPAGSYLIEVVATTPDGEVSKAVRPFLVAR